jgi:F-type H+-transporting ATPase subunit delta
MRISKQARHEARRLLRACRVDGLLDERRVRQVVQLVLARKPRDYLRLLHQFGRLVKLDLERRAARVENAVESPPELEASIREKLSQQYGPGMNTLFVTNPELIGGLRIRVGNDVYDGSIRSRLEQFKNSF